MVNVKNIYSSNSWEDVEHKWNMHSTMNYGFIFILSWHNKELHPQLQTLKFTRMFHLLQSFDSQHFPKIQSLSSWTIHVVFPSSSPFSFMYIFFSVSLSSIYNTSSSSYRQTKNASLSTDLTLKIIITIYLKTLIRLIYIWETWTFHYVRLSNRNWPTKDSNRVGWDYMGISK